MFRIILIAVAGSLLFTPPVRAEKPAAPPSALQQAADFVLWPLQHYREEMARQKVADNLRQLGIRVYQSPTDPLPQRPWAETILPYIEQSNLYAPYLYMASGVSPTAV